MPPAPSSSSLHSVTAPARLTSSSPRRYTACTCTPPAPSSSSLHNVAAPAREIFEGPLFSKMDYSSSSCNMPNQENDTHENINEDIAGHNPTVVDEYMPPRSSRQPKKRKATDKRVMSSVEPEDDDPSKAAMKVLDDEYSRFHTVVGNDVDKFLKEDIENGGTGFDILVWWRLNEARLPILSQVARDILAVPISTVASESAFSTGGRVLDAFRSSLTPKVVQCLICGQDWFRKSSVPINIEEALEDIDKLDEGLHGIALEGSTD